jgi:hypothetical protein
MFAELESFIKTELGKLAADGKSIEEKLMTALHLGHAKSKLEAIAADTTTTTEAKVVTAFQAGQETAAAPVPPTAA